VPRAQSVAEWVAREALNASSPYAPYLASMPTLRDARHTLSYESFPLAYLHLLQDGGPLVGARVGAWLEEGVGVGAEDGHAIPGATLAAPLPRLQSAHIVEKRTATLRYWSTHGARLLRSGVTLEALRAALVTVGSSQSCARSPQFLRVRTSLPSVVVPMP
jgi:hypothetical protein